MFTIITGDRKSERDTLERAKRKAFYDALYLKTRSEVFDRSGKLIYRVDRQER